MSMGIAAETIMGLQPSCIVQPCAPVITSCLHEQALNKWPSTRLTTCECGLNRRMDDTHEDTWPSI